MCEDTGDKFIEYGTALSVTTSPQKYIELEKEAVKFNTENKKFNYAELLQLNNLLYTNCLDYQREFEINYVLGSNGYSDYDAFVDEWLRIGGNTLKKQAESQFKYAGYIK